MAVNISYNIAEDKVFITDNTSYVRSGICINLSELKEEDIVKLLMIKRENL